MRLRQVATVARELEPAVNDFRAVLGIEVAYRDPGVSAFGLHNAVMPIGDTFLEVVSPRQGGTTAGRFLERQGGDAGYMVILQTDEDMDKFRRRMKKLHVRTVWTADHDDIRGTHLHPKDVGGAILSVDWANPRESWRWAGPQWHAKVRTGVVREILAAEMASVDPAAMAKRWAQVLERKAVARDDGRWEIVLDRGRLLFRLVAAGGAEGVVAFHLDAADPRRALDSAARRGLPSAGDRARVGGVDLVFTGPAAREVAPRPAAAGASAGSR
jgi:glyoxalase-like protein